MRDFLRLAEEVLAGEARGEARSGALGETRGESRGEARSGALGEAEALEILSAEGAALTVALAGAHRIREVTFGDGVELCSIINAKSGRCGEDCAFCAQSGRHRTDAPVFELRARGELLAAAREAAALGSRCFGIVTSGTRVKDPAEWEVILGAIREIRDSLPIEPAASLGLLDTRQAAALAEAGCMTYHHNLETARSFFPRICTTHAYDEDLDTVRSARAAGMQVCCGGILGLGESAEQRVELAFTLRELGVGSVPLNFLVPIRGTPLEDMRQLTPMDCLRAIAMFRFVLPRARISVCGGRGPNLRELQAWIFTAGASGTMVGNYLTTTGRDRETDLQMIADAGFRIKRA